MPQLTPEQLAYDIDDLRALQALAGQRMQQLEQESQTVEQRLIHDSGASINTLKAILAKQKLLLADNVTVGSIREWKARPIADRISNKGQNDLANILIGMVQGSRDAVKQLLRQTKLTAQDFEAAEVEEEAPPIV